MNIYVRRAQGIHLAQALTGASGRPVLKGNRPSWGRSRHDLMGHPALVARK